MKIMLQFGELNITPSVVERLEELDYTPESLASDVDYHKSACEGNPSIYCGTYGKYNDGCLQGLWIDLTTFDDYEELLNFCYAIHADEADPELDVQDWECMPTGLDGDDIFSEERFEQLKDYNALCEKYETDAVDAYLGIYNLDDLDRFEERYQGKYDSERDFAEHIVDECYDLDRLMGRLSYYFDYDAYARDLFMEGYSFDDGYVFCTC